MKKSWLYTLPFSLAALSIILGSAPSAAATASEKPFGSKNIDVAFPQTASLIEIYTSAGEEAGVKVFTDTKLKDRNIAIELENVTFEEFLHTITKAHNHFYAFLDDNSIIIADDTPQNRRQYEPQALRTFYLHHVDGRDLMTTLRSMLALKHIAFDQTLNAMVIRDTARRVAIAERLIESHDRRPSEILLALEVLSVDALTLEALRKKNVEKDDGLYISQNVFKELRAHQYSESLAQPQLQLIDSRPGTLKLTDQILNTAGENADIELGMSLDAKARIGPAQDSVMVDLDLTFRHLMSNDCVQNGQLGERTLKTTLHLQEDQTYLLSGLVQTVKLDQNGGQQTLSGLFGCGVTKGNQNELILAITPYIVYRAEVPNDEMSTLWIGNEGREALRN